MAGPSVIALIAAYNEADVVGWVVRDLIAQGVAVYFLDDGSTDATVAAVEPFLGRGVLKIERLAEHGSTPGHFEWERILRRKEVLAHELSAEWFIHQDADEFRESPWRGINLTEAIALVDRSGFNAIDALSLDFWPTHDDFQPGCDVREAFSHYLPGAPFDYRQVRCWKKTSQVVDLASSGGHDVQFPERRVFPMRFLSRHYPIRSQAHGERKVLRERLPRFAIAERARGWHVQYLNSPASFLRDPATLIPYDADAIRLQLNLRSLEQLQAALDAARSAQAAEGERFAQQEQALLTSIEHLQRTVAQYERDLAGHRAALDDAKQQLRAITQSWSWRVTGMARALFRMFTGRAS